MYKTFYIFLFFILFCCEVKTQTEYITNGSFEQIDSCYGNYAPIGLDVFEWSGCKGWSNPIKSSSDLWCYGGKIGVFSPPANPSGYQFARTGNNFAGILIGSGTFNANYREYVQNNLQQPLKLNKIYNIEFYLSDAVIPCATNQYGVKFFNTKYNNSTTYWLTNLIPDAINGKSNFITDTLGWQKVSLQYKANGTENYIVIGCFADSLNLTIEPNGCDTSGNGVPYVFGVGNVFIDDVSIIEIENYPPIIPNVFTPNGDNSNDVWQFTLGLGNNLKSLHIYNRWGLEVKSSQIQTQSFIKWDGYTTSGEPCTAGVYFYTLEYSNVLGEQKKLNGYITLIK